MTESCLADKNMNNHTCYEEEPSAWLGLHQQKENWFELDNDEKSPEYMNWEKSGTASGYGDATCAYMKGNGVWRYGTKNKCNSVVLKLCPVCYVVGTPVFTLSSFQDKMWVDYNFYMVPNNSSEVDYYEGYKNAEIIKENRSWKIRPKHPNKQQENVELPITDSTLSPTGRNQWYYYALDEKIENAKNRTAPFSHCNFGEEFTCTLGGCVEKNKRCNYAKDCVDGSDEEHCSPILVPPEYSDAKPPHNGTSKLVMLRTQINILSIDSIDRSGTI